MNQKSLLFLLSGIIFFAIVSCEDDPQIVETTNTFDTTIVIDTTIIIGDTSTNTYEPLLESETPVLLALQSGFESVDIEVLMSSEDVLPSAPDFVYGSMADGAGLLKNDDGTYTLINNIEADYSVARLTLNEDLRPINGEYILNANASAFTAQCSGSLITPEEHGFGPLYLSGGEWGGGSKGVFVLDPYKNASDASFADMLNSFGQWSTENAVVIGKDAFPGTTIAFIGDDHSDNSVPSGQLGMYVGGYGDLYNGTLYGLSVTADGIEFEMDMVEGETYEAEFVVLEEKTKDALDEEAKSKKVMGFSRLEDIDWRRGSAANQREVYLTVTGRKKDDLVGKGTLYGRIYKVVLDESDYTKATITCILDGDNLTGKAKQFHSPDNIVVTENYAYIQEDPNGYPDTSDKDHYAYLYQYDLNTGDLSVVLACDQVNAASLGYGTTDRTWELTGMIDITETIGASESTFILITQNHGWERANGEPFTDPNANPAVEGSRAEGSVLHVVRGLAR
ncbi:MAG: PhoX family protein [bacterium]|nr:PhoX family protein [bacterium]